MEVSSKDGIGDTIVVDDWKPAITKNGAAFVIKTPYENVIIEVSRDKLLDLYAKSEKLSRELAKENGGKEVRYWGKER